MATLYISEFYLTADAGEQVARQPALTNQTVAITGGHLESSAFTGDTKLVRLQPDAICSVSIGASPAAATTSMRMAADQTEYFEVTPGHKVSVISNT